MSGPPDGGGNEPPSSDDPSGLDPASAEARLVALYSDYHTLCYQVARSILPQHDEALDAVQEVFLHLLAGAPASLARTLGPSFFRIAARNQAIRILRKRGVEHTALGRLRVEQESAGVISFPDPTAHLLLDPTVQRFLVGLPALRTRVFELCYGLGFSSREAAEHLGVSQKAVEKQRKKLERDLRHFRGGEKWGAEAFVVGRGRPFQHMRGVCQIFCVRGRIIKRALCQGRQGRGGSGRRASPARAGSTAHSPS